MVRRRHLGHLMLAMALAAPLAARVALLPGPAAAQEEAMPAADAVREVQELLWDAGYPPGPATGVLDAETVAAIERYQTDWGLEVTGRITPDLVARLKREHPDTRARWFKVENSDCTVWNPFPQAGEIAIWSGGCAWGRVEGEGVMTWVYALNGRMEAQTYAAPRVAGRLEGRGLAIFANGDRYEGDFVEDRQEGMGTFTWADGGTYSGGWKDDTYHGEGVMQYANGDRYEGQWREGRQQGEGTYAWADGAVYVGSFVEDRIEGTGAFTNAAGDRFEGGFRSGNFHGTGVYTFADGSSCAAEWQDGTMVGTGTGLRDGVATTCHQNASGAIVLD